jgi:hypothetical protein
LARSQRPCNWRGFLIGSHLVDAVKEVLRYTGHRATLEVSDFSCTTCKITVNTGSQLP